MSTTDIFDWSWKEAVETVETTVEEDLEHCDHEQKKEYIALLKSKLDKLIPFGGNKNDHS
tara:strand:- start:20 stop:199 length:180 start_codon:yes stop_codon:yes gene_type:complete